MDHRRDVRSLNRMQLRKELLALRAESAKTREDDEGRGGSPCEWMDERAAEIRTELRSRARWR